MFKASLMVSGFTLVYMVSASAQVVRSDNTRLGDQPWWRTQNWCLGTRGAISLCERMRDERRDNTILGNQPWWRTQNWCVDARGVIFLCRQ